MTTKFNLADEVMVKAKITEIHVNKDGQVLYKCRPASPIYLNEEDLPFYLDEEDLPYILEGNIRKEEINITFKI